jgi:hypothetical protein
MLSNAFGRCRTNVTMEGRQHEEGIARFCNRTRCRRVSCRVTHKQEPRNEQSVGWHLGARLRTAAPHGCAGYQDTLRRTLHFAAYDTQTGKPLYAAGGTYILNGSSYTEHMYFASDKIDAGLIDKDQSFIVKVDADTLTQKGTLTNGKTLSEIWKRVN